MTHIVAVRRQMVKDPNIETDFIEIWSFIKSWL